MGQSLNKIVVGLAAITCIFTSPSAHAERLDWPSGMHAAISITYDDGYINNLDNAIPTLEAHGYRGTFFLTTSIVDRLDRGTPRNLIQEWRQAFFNGHEIGSHGSAHVCHDVTGYINDSYTLEEEVMHSKVWLDTYVAADPYRSYAYPCGETKAYDNRPRIGTFEDSETLYPNYVDQHYHVGRTGNGPFNNPFNFRQNHVLINGHAIGKGLGNDNLDYVKGILDQAAASGDWTVLIFHDVGGNAEEPVLPVTKSFHDQVIGEIYRRGVFWVAPMKNVASYIRGNT